MNILMIGGTGVLSSAVTSEALKKGHTITMINRGRRKLPEGVEVIISDMNDYETIKRALYGRKFDAIMDFLCYTVEQTIASFNLYKDYTSQYFYISSMAVYDKTIPGVLVEDHPKPLACWQYSIDKWNSEKKLMELASQSDCNYTIIRPAVTYGNTRIPYGITPQYGYHWTMMERALHNKPLITWDGVDSVHEAMMRVEDFAVCMVALIGNPKAMNEAFNICGDEKPTFQDVIDVMSDYINKEVPTIKIPAEWYAEEIPHRKGELLGGRRMTSIRPEGDTREVNEKIKTLVPDYYQRTLLKEGIFMTLDNYKTNNYQHGIDWKFDAECDRIIHKWCQNNNIDISQYNIGFVDYLGNAKSSDKFAYWFEFHKNKLFVRFLSKSSRLLMKIKRKLFK